MVGKTTRQFYNVDTMEEYHELIKTCHAKAMNKKAGQLFNQFDKQQKKDFISRLVLDDLKTEAIHFINLL